MSKTSIKKQLKFIGLTSHIQNVMKINFVSSLKMCIFATVNRLLGLPRESAFSLCFVDVKTWTLFTKYLVEMKGILTLACCVFVFPAIHQVEYIQKPISTKYKRESKPSHRRYED